MKVIQPMADITAFPLVGTTHSYPSVITAAEVVPHLTTATEPAAEHMVIVNTSLYDAS
jgi:hypothetical protein